MLNPFHLPGRRSHIRTDAVDASDVLMQSARVRKTKRERKNYGRVAAADADAGAMQIARPPLVVSVLGLLVTERSHCHGLVKAPERQKRLKTSPLAINQHLVIVGYTRRDCERHALCIPPRRAETHTERAIEAPPSILILLLPYFGETISAKFSYALCV